MWSCNPWRGSGISGIYPYIKVTGYLCMFRYLNIFKRLYQYGSPLNEASHRYREPYREKKSIKNHTCDVIKMTENREKTPFKKWIIPHLYVYVTWQIFESLCSLWEPPYNKKITNPNILFSLSFKIKMKNRGSKS